MISHFYLTPTSSPPDSNLVFSLRGENDERDSGSIEEINWILDTFCHVTKNPSQPMDILSPYVFKSELVHGLMLSFENAPPENQQKILNFISIVIRRMRANNINESVNYLSSTYYCEDIIDDIKNITCDKNSTNYKISLLSLYDYYKAGGKSSFLNNGETFYLGTLNKDNHNYYITSDGEVSINEISTRTYAVRPVITIISSSVLLSGKGTKDDPYRILEIKPSTLEEATINTYVSFSNQIFKVIDNSTDATKVALNGVIKENDIDVVKSFGGKNNKYSNSKNTVGYYLNNTYLKTLDSKNIIKSNWYIGALSLDNLDYTNEKNTKINLSVGMLSLGDMFVGDINNVLTLSRGIESDQIINVINKEGNFYGDFITSKYNVRPALYLNNELKITGGNGTFDAPYELGVSDEKGQE